MGIDAEVQALIARTKSIADSGRRERVALYAHGLGAKFRQVEYTIGELSSLTAKAPGPGGPSGFSDFDRIHFYSDSFFALQRAVLDILAQLINQTEGLGLNERECDFTRLVAQLQLQTPTAALTNRLVALNGSASYSALNDYRNCSLHRRQVYLEYQTRQKLYSTPGYATGPFTSHEWYVCDNPLDVHPNVNSRRVIVPYCSLLLADIETHIRSILPTLVP